jgi:Flp pilus assembly pilin Flp
MPESSFCGNSPKLSIRFRWTSIVGMLETRHMSLLRFAISEIKRLHDDEAGAPEASTVMIMALIGIPLILLLITFGSKIAEMLKNIFQTLMGKTSTVPQTVS